MEGTTEVVMGLVHNTHQREIHAPAEAVAGLLGTLGGAEDLLWPSPAWMPMRLDRPLGVGADGGHGPIRYRVSAYEPGRRIRFAFRPPTRFDGTHAFEVRPLGEDRALLRHTVTGRPRGLMRLLWPLAVRPLHDALIEDLFDNAERAVSARSPRPARWSPWVRVLRLRTRPVASACPVPEAARLAHDALDGVRPLDAVAVRARPGTGAGPQEWADAVFRDPPRWVLGLLLLREALVGLIGVERAGREAFDTVRSRPGEVLLGTDSGHLDFRASVLVDTDDGRETVTLTTVVRLHNRRGRLYWAVVRPLHPLVVRAMLGRAAHRLAHRAWTARLGTPVGHEG
ncbi:DUF2867 domain-containing protein [Nocardiopsis sp. NPDC058789]|uniref:DUF2867 domain-containing protein n=1 Tax=Nocardiopsis sp. NPDC058789 TaxID=3346634 RepID=UPI00366D9827